MASLALREAGRHGPLADKRVLILGAGKIAERVAKELAHVGAGKIVVANRTLPNAERLCAAYGGTAASLSDLRGLLCDTDVVFAALATEGPIVDAQLLDGLTGQLLLVDLGVPRNVDAKCADLPSVCLVDMEGLAERCAANSERRLAALPHALEILDEELKTYEEALTERHASGTIGALVQKGEEIRKRNLEWALPHLAELDDSQRKVVEDLTARIVKGMLESPISELKGALTEPHERAIAERLFGLAGGGE